VKATGKKLTRLQSVVWAEQASKGETHDERMQWIEKNVPENFRALVRDHMVYYLAQRIYHLPTKEIRRAAIDDIPLDCDPTWARSLVECIVLSMWKEERKMVR
jgi:hypothetical protein